MPVILDQTQSTVVQPEVKKDYNEVVMKGFYVDDEDAYCDIAYRKKMNGVEVEGGRLFTHRIDGAAFGAIALAAPVGATRRDDLKTALYNQMLLDLNLTGTVE